MLRLPLVAVLRQVCLDERGVNDPDASDIRMLGGAVRVRQRRELSDEVQAGTRALAGRPISMLRIES